MEEKRGVTRAELSGWVQVVLAIVGLYFTIKQAYPTIGAIGRLGSGRGLPADLQGAQGAIQVFIVILVLVTLLMLLFVGLAVVLGALFRQLDAKAPRHSAFSLIASVVLCSISLSMAIIGSSIWIPSAFLAILMLVASAVAAVESSNTDEMSMFWGIMILGVPGAVIFGIFLMSISGPNMPQNVAEKVISGHKN